MAYYVQTPYLWFPIEPHYLRPFVHWLPASYRIQRMAKKGIGIAKRIDDYDLAAEHVKHCQLLDRTQFSHLFPDSQVISERFAFMTKSLIAVRS